MTNSINISNIPNKIFITGIDTDAGKSYITGYLCRYFNEHGISSTTLKFIQTGNINRSEDIEIHRKIMGVDLTKEDLDLVSAPEIFSYPCSPDLASRIDGREINFDKIDNSISILSKNYETILIEGAGGIMVPLQKDFLTIDYIKNKNLPVLLVTNGKLGSINHTLLSLYAIKQYGIELWGVVYNTYFDKDKIIAQDTRKYIRQYLDKNFPKSHYLEVEEISLSQNVERKRNTGNSSIC